LRIFVSALSLIVHAMAKWTCKVTYATQSVKVLVSPLRDLADSCTKEVLQYLDQRRFAQISHFISVLPRFNHTIADSFITLL
jgi:hypothetical protein